MTQDDAHVLHDPDQTALVRGSSPWIQPATFPGVLVAAAVEKLFFAVAGVAVSVHLFLSVGGSFRLQFGSEARHPWLSALTVAVVAVAVRPGPALAGRPSCRSCSRGAAAWASGGRRLVTEAWIGAHRRQPEPR